MIPFSPLIQRTRNPNWARSLHRAFATPAVNKQKNPDRYDDSVASGASTLYLESLYTQYKADPSALPPSWHEYFQKVDAGAAPDRPPVGGPALRDLALNARLGGQAGSATGVTPQAAGGPQNDALSVRQLVVSYRRRGHEIAQLDPLGLYLWRGENPKQPQELSHTFHGFSDQDLDRPLQIGGMTSKHGYTGYIASLQAGGGGVTLREVMDAMHKMYCGHLGVEYMHIMDVEVTNWIRSQVEDPDFGKQSKEQMLRHFRRLVNANEFELFCGKTFKTTKRFGLDGCEAMIPGLGALIDKATDGGVDEFVIGMPHRGRLNVLGNVLKKPLEQLLSEFQDKHYDVEETLKSFEQEDWAAQSDVKYHLGTNSRKPAGTTNQHDILMTLESNPSHLETVDPICLGRTRAKQFYSTAEAGATNEGVETESLKNHHRVLPIQFHGDASFAGQGVVYECMQLQGVRNFNVGGTVHVVVNNQVGFTTNPWDSRSTLYCSDIGKAFAAPVFHCNADDVMSVVKAFELAAGFRQTFQRDVIVDIICFRRFGHNEIDNPDFTQPIMYKNIKAHPSTQQITADKLIKDNVATKEELDVIIKTAKDNLAAALEKSKSWTPEDVTKAWVPTEWKGFVRPTGKTGVPATGVPINELAEFGTKIATLPADFTPHKIVAKTYASRKEALKSQTGIDWGGAETLAWASLLREGYHVRITGQDVGRGTFSHRHCVLTDQQNDRKQYVPLNHMNATRHAYNKELALPKGGGQRKWDPKKDQATFTGQNSILAEYAVLGYELGYSYENPYSLCIWEAQFGDFANTAQVVTDQFIVAAESKWGQRTGLVLLLPHGYDGQGAEHSSCRMERFLQLADDDEDDAASMITVDQDKPSFIPQQLRANMCVVNISTPANYFHLLRRQCKREYRKPLVVIAPKKLLRHPLARSDLKDFGPESRFHRLLDERDPTLKPDDITRLVFCTGQIYYDLVEERTKLGVKNTAIITLEEIAPFPYDHMKKIFEKYKNVDHGDGVHPGDVIWCQEEPKNNGAWSYVRSRMVTTAREGVDKDTVIRYVGRRAAAAPATGLAKLHAAEQQAVLKAALLGHDDESGPRASPLLGHTT